MNEFESGSRARGNSGEPRRAAEMHEDLEALRASTARELPSLDRVVTRARDRLRDPATVEERFMATIRMLKGRPWLTTAVAAVVMAVALLVIPISYQRTVAHDVALRVAGTDLGTAQISSIAHGLEAVLGVHGIRVEAEAGGAASTYTFSASVPEKPGVNVPGLAQAFANGLRTRGFVATAETTPRTERVWGSVYAYTRDQVIHIETSGKSNADLEAEIRQRLAEAGVSDAQVSVTDDPNGKRISVEMEQDRSGSGGGDLEGAVDLQLTQGGLPIGQNGCAVKVEKRVQGSTTVLHVEVTKDGHTTNIDVPNADSMSDAALASAIQSQLQSAGLDLQVTVEQGKIQIGKK